MAFAPVLERENDIEEKGYSRELFRDTLMTADEKHNSKISYNYAKLINPELSLNDIIERNEPVSRVEDISVSPVQEEVAAENIYLVENARADADIFRADSAINKKVEETEDVTVDSLQDEEENEDLRPTPTTIQYQTANIKKASEEGKISVKSEKKFIGFNKKDKIIIAVAITVIIALFVLIIVNSAVISGLNSDVSALQNTLTEAENAYTEALSAKEAYLEESNLFQVVTNFATSNGMSLR